MSPSVSEGSFEQAARRAAGPSDLAPEGFQAVNT